MPGKWRKPEARRIIYEGALKERTLEQVNEELRRQGFDDELLPESSWTSIRRNEVPLFRRSRDYLEAFVRAPKPRSWIREELGRLGALA